MAVKLFLNSNEILNRVFSSTTKGYDPLEVDKFLDFVLEDYRTIESNLLLVKKDYVDLVQKNKNLEAKNRELEIELKKYEAKFSNIKDSDNVTSDNMDILKKINAYEKFLWSRGFNPDLIK